MQPENFFFGIGITLVIVGVILLFRPNVLPAIIFRGYYIHTGIALIALGLISSAFPFSAHFYRSLSPSDVEPSLAPADAKPSVTSKRPSAPSVQIKVPAQDISVGYSTGTKIAGTASNVDGRSLVVLNIEESPTGNGRVYYTASDPLHVINGEWGTVVAPIGSQNDEQEIVTFVVVLADEKCTELINELHAKPEDRQYLPDPLPPGCEGPADSVRVVKDHV